MGFIIRLLVSGLAVFITAKVLPGVTVDGFLTAIIVAVVLGVLNAVVKPVIQILTLPITVITLGLFLLIINAAIILLADYFVSGFSVDGWIMALVFSFIITIVSSVLEVVTGSGDKKK